MRSMFLGHFAVAFAAKAAAPKTSLGTLFAASQFVDLLWPALLLLGAEQVAVTPGATAVTPLDFRSYPISHSLLAVMGWSLAAGALYFAARRYRRGAVVVGTLVLSHWLLDAVVHRPDLPLIPGMPVFAGLGLWNSRAGTLATEYALLACGVIVYVHRTRARGRLGSAALAALVVLLAAIYLANVFGPPPPSATAIAWAGHLQWLFVAWAWWLDRRRRPRETGASAA